MLALLKGPAEPGGAPDGDDDGYMDGVYVGPLIYKDIPVDISLTFKQTL